LTLGLLTFDFRQREALEIWECWSAGVWEYPTANKECPISKGLGLMVQILTAKDTKRRLGLWIHFQPRIYTNFTNAFSTDETIHGHLNSEL
jgi:hypothetical protein